MKPLIIYHSPCADGAGAAFAAWHKFHEDAEYRPANYGDATPTDDDVRGRDVFILDFSYQRQELLRLYAAARNLHIVDHHKTAQAALGDLDYATFDMEHSGAVLAWRHFHGVGPVPEILLYIEDRDLWRWNMYASKEVSAAIDARGVWKNFRNLEEIYQLEDLSSLMDEGRMLLCQQRMYVDTIVAFAYLQRGLAGVDLAHYVVNTPLLQSEVGNVLASRGAAEGHAPMAAVWHQNEHGQFKVSLRSVGDYDVSTIAKKFGGGGHKNAASFLCDVLPW